MKDTLALQVETVEPEILQSGLAQLQDLDQTCTQEINNLNPNSSQGVGMGMGMANQLELISVGDLDLSRCLDSPLLCLGGGG